LPGPTPATTGTPDGVLSNVFNGTLPAANPPVITSSTATIPKQILIKWNGSLNSSNNTDKTIVQYHIFRAPGAVAVGSPLFFDIAIVPSTGGSASAGTGCANYTSCGYLDNSAILTDGTVFTYYVEADNNRVAVGACTGSTCSGPSNITQQFTMPGVARNVATSATAQQTIHVSWTAPASGTVSTYDVLRANSLTGTYNPVGSCTGLSNTTFSCDNTGLATNTTFFFEIRANITGSTSPATDPTSSQTSPGISGTTLPPAVSGLTATTTLYNSVTLGWTSIAGATYKVYRSSVPPALGPVYQDVFTGVATNSFVNNAATNKAVFPGITYHYAVTAVNAGGEGPFPTDFTVTTPSAPWNPANAGLPGGGWLNQILVDGSTAPGILYAATGKLVDTTPSGVATGGVFKFIPTPGPNTWAPVNNGIPNGSIVTCLAAELQLISVLKLYAGTNGAGVFVSLDGGATWNPVAATGLTNGNIARLFVDNTTTATQGTLWVGGVNSGGSTGGIFSLAPASTTWTVSLPGTTATVQAFAQDATGGMWAQLAGASTASPAGGLWKLTAGTWSQAANQPFLGVDCSATRAGSSAFTIDLVPTIPVIYWGSSSCGLLSRPLSGTTWAVVAGYTTPAITRLALLDTGTAAAPIPQIWVGSADPSAAHGVTYLKATATPTAVHMTNTAFAGPPFWEPTALALDPTDATPTHLYSGSSDGSGAYFSTNANLATGGSFSKSNSGLSNLNVKVVIRDPSSSSNVFAASDQFGVATSTDAGATWVAAVPTGCTNSVVALAYDATSTTIFALCQSQGIFQGAFNSGTNTTTWSTVACTNLPGTPNFSRGIALLTGGTDKLYFATQGTPATVWITDASGGNIAKTCTALTPALPAAITDATALAVDTNKAVYVGSPSAFVSTLCTTTACTTASANWVAAGTGPKSVNSFFIDTHPATNVVYAAGRDDGTGVGGIWSGSIATVLATTTVAWATVPTASPSNVTTASVVTGFNGLAPSSGPPPLFAGTTLTAGQQYANVFRAVGGNWSASGDGITAGNVLSMALPDNSGTSTGSLVVLAATSGGGIFKTTTGGQ
jgi:hypothetical protein